MMPRLRRQPDRDTHSLQCDDRSNAILVCSAPSGTRHRLDFLIGDRKALDTTRHFIVATDPIGNGLSSSPSNSVAQPGMQFPRYGVRDMVQMVAMTAVAETPPCSAFVVEAARALIIAAPSTAERARNVASLAARRLRRR